MFLSGLIKYSERTMSLFRASLNRFRDSMLNDPDPGPDYAKVMDEYRSMREAKLPTRIERIEEPERGKQAMDVVKEGPLNDNDSVLFAHHFFETFKGLIVDLIFSNRDRSKSRHFFRNRTARDTFKVITLELSFIYDVLFTKVRVVYTPFGYVGRFVASCLVVASLALFYRVDKGEFLGADVAITYTLLYGAMVLDAIAFVKLIASNWLTVKIKKLPDVHLNPTAAADAATKQQAEKEPLFDKLANLAVVRFLRQHWSGAVANFNLINYCLNRGQPEKERMMEFFHMPATFDSIKYVKYKEFSDGLRDHIFEELKKKSDMAEDDLDTAKEASEARGDWALRVEPDCGELLPYVRGMDYDRSLLLWHIATEICWCTEIAEEEEKLKQKLQQEDSNNPQGEGEGEGEEDVKKDYREFSKVLSDYMLYLLIMQPTMMSAVAGIRQIRFRDTCAEAEKFLKGTREIKPPAIKVLAYVLSFSGIYLIIGLLSPILSFIFSLFITLFLPLLPRTTVDCLEERARSNKTCSIILDYLSPEKKELVE